MNVTLIIGDAGLSQNRMHMLPPWTEKSRLFRMNCFRIEKRSLKVDRVSGSNLNALQTENMGYTHIILCMLDEFLLSAVLGKTVNVAASGQPAFFTFIYLIQ